MHSTGFEPARTRCPVRLKRTPLDHSGTNATVFSVPRISIQVRYNITIIQTIVDLLWINSSSIFINNNIHMVNYISTSKHIHQFYIIYHYSHIFLTNKHYYIKCFSVWNTNYKYMYKHKHIWWYIKNGSMYSLLFYNVDLCIVFDCTPSLLLI